jgi:signal transduction histidine kinase
MLHEFLTDNTAEIIARTRTKVATRRSPMPTEAELRNGVPLFLTQIIDRLSLATTDNGIIEQSAALHGGELLAMGFSISQVVHGYGDICQAVTQLADETDALISPSEFHTFNRCLDDAIAQAVSAYERRRDESAAYEGTERQGMVAHEMRNRLNGAMLAFTLLQEGTIGMGGTTAAMLGRNLRALRDLVNNSLAGVRLESGLHGQHRVSVSELIEDAKSEAAVDAAAGGFNLTVTPVTPGIDVNADAQIFAAALGNLLQNAFKFSHPRGHVALRTSSTPDHVLIEVEDECGGLPPGNTEDLFLPFSQRSPNRTGLGLGLSITRKGVEAMDGTLSVRDLPGKGCVFSIELPRLAAS